MKLIEIASPKYQYPFRALCSGLTKGGSESYARRSSRHYQTAPSPQSGAALPPVLVLLHGHMAHSMAFRRVWARLGTRFRLIMPDLPGHGTDKTFSDLNVQPRVVAIAQWLLDFLDALNAYLSDHSPDQVHLGGHSLGASVAYEAGLLEPHRFSSMSLISPGFCVRVPPGAATVLDHLPVKAARWALSRHTLRLIEPLRWQGQPMNSAEVAAYLKPFKDLGRLEFSLRLGADLLRNPCPIDALKPLKLPTLLMFGALDNAMALERAAEVAARLGARRLEIVPTAGHSPPEDTPAEFSDILLDFIAACHSERGLRSL